MMKQPAEIHDVVWKIFATSKDSLPLSKCIQQYVDEMQESILEIVKILVRRNYLDLK